LHAKCRSRREKGCDDQIATVAKPHWLKGLGSAISLSADFGIGQDYQYAAPAWSDGADDTYWTNAMLHLRCSGPGAAD
jgi:hypothetical protein